jgi:hypothetical protein
MLNAEAGLKVRNYEKKFCENDVLELKAAL